MQQWGSSPKTSSKRSLVRGIDGQNSSKQSNLATAFFPAKSKDHELEVRYDAGHFDGRFRTVYLQVNSQAKSTALKKWLAKQKSKGTHANLATGQIDTEAEDPEAEGERLLRDLNKQVDENLG